MTVETPAPNLPKSLKLPPLRKPMYLHKPLVIFRPKGDETVVDMVLRHGGRPHIYLNGSLKETGGEVVFSRSTTPYWSRIAFKLTEISFEEAEALSRYFDTLAKGLKKAEV